jgi:hypothetical protein
MTALLRIRKSSSCRAAHPGRDPGRLVIADVDIADRRFGEQFVEQFGRSPGARLPRT